MALRLGIPEQLPIAAHAEAITAALHQHQVVVVAGETGSGKTTQLPKIALAAGRGTAGMIGHTQPRRIAARTLAARIAEECDVELGAEVGFAVRFTDRTAKGTRVKVMTDGILLAELQRDRDLRRYDTIIIDEAHERSLNIDFLLGYLVRLLPRRADLRVVVTSATIDVERFSAHFGGAPIIEVSGRTYPVEIRHRPTEDVASDDVDAVCGAVLECLTSGDGDVLVFLSGQREIHDVADALRPMLDRVTTVLPLYARLSTAEQHRVFAPGGGRRVVLATNVAETSITVPGIRYVVDPGTARISRYSKRLKVQRLPIEPISQASANQRAGRCGRVRDGIAIRLYSEQDLLDRPAFTDPEILRTNLASVILQMAALRLGEIERFPFLDPPDSRQIRDGVALLHELGALKDGGGPPRLTPLGRQLARLPLDPRLGRMVLAAAGTGCVREVVVIVAGLTIQDPRERPEAERGRADAAHARFADRRSDFDTLLNLWEHIREVRSGTSSNGLRRACREQYLNYLRIREWQDLVAQIRETPGRPGHRLEQRARGPRRHPSGAADRDALPGGDVGPAPPRLPGGAGGAVRHLPGIRAGALQPRVGHVLGAGRDVAAVRAEERRGQAGVDRGGGRPPGVPELLRAALVGQAGRHDGGGAGDPLRDPAGHRPTGRLRPHRPGCSAASSSSGPPWSRETGARTTGSGRRTRRPCGRPRSSRRAAGAGDW